MSSTTSSPSIPLRSPRSHIALACFANMFSVGTVYALSTLQVELPRLLGVSQHLSYAPFGVACIGLSIGVRACAPLVTKYGPIAVVASGTALWGIAMASAGYFLAQLDFQAVLLSLAFGGIGVGLTYLAVVVLVSQSFPDQPLARSAIGPLGFSSGTCTCIALYKLLRFDNLDVLVLGQSVTTAGMVFLGIAAITMVMVKANAPSKNTPRSIQGQPKTSSGLLFSTLLFSNALPGMTVFAALIPGALNWKRGQYAIDPIDLLCWGMLALTLGGFLAPAISSRLGAKATFATLFYVRGLLLIIFSQSPESSMAAVTFLAVLFGHGTGFSVLPGLIKSRASSPAQFTSNYGQVLVSWGASGVAAVMINAQFTTSLDGMRTAGLWIGSMALLSGAALQFCNFGL